MSLSPREWKIAVSLIFMLLGGNGIFTRGVRVARVQRADQGFKFVRKIEGKDLSKFRVGKTVHPLFGACLFILDLLSPWISRQIASGISGCRGVFPLGLNPVIVRNTTVLGSFELLEDGSEDNRVSLARLLFLFLLDLACQCGIQLDVKVLYGCLYSRDCGTLRLYRRRGSRRSARLGSLITCGNGKSLAWVVPAWLPNDHAQ